MHIDDNFTTPLVFGIIGFFVFLILKTSQYKWLAWCVIFPPTIAAMVFSLHYIIVVGEGDPEGGIISAAWGGAAMFIGLLIGIIKSKAD